MLTFDGSHPLDGARLKVRRAVRKIDALAREQETFRGQTNYQIVAAELNPKNGNQVYRVLIDVLPSLDWGLCISSIAHDLRSALDNMVWQLALLNTRTPLPNTAFPIFLLGSTKRRRTKKPGKGKPPFLPCFKREGLNVIKSLKSEHQAAIERMQPYKRGNGGKLNPFYLLSEINNADKHRLVQVAGVKPKYLLWGKFRDHEDMLRSNELIVDHIGVILEDGAVIAEAPPHVYMHGDTLPIVAFWKGCEAVEGMPVCTTLKTISDNVARTISRAMLEF